MGLKRTDEFRQDAVRIARTSGQTRWIVGAAMSEIGTMLALTAVLMLIVSRPFGLFL